MIKLSEEQMEWGELKLKDVCKEWEVSEEIAVKILSSKTQKEFYQWVNASLFLSIMRDKFYKTPKKLKEFCKKCPNSDNSVNYSNVHYCNNPKNRREFTFIRHFSDYGGDELEVLPPMWCPYK